MTVAELFTYIWGLMGDVGVTISNMFVSVKDIFIFVILATLAIKLIAVILGGD